MFNLLQDLKDSLLEEYYQIKNSEIGNLIFEVEDLAKEWLYLD